MGQYADLNQIIQDYKISKTGGVEELLELQKRLSDIPIRLKKLEKRIDYFFNCQISELIIRAEFYDPPMRIVLLDEFVEHEEADSITERMVLPYPVIWINGEGVSDGFYEDAKNKLGELVFPDKRDPTARVLSNLDCSGAAIIYERDKKLYYVEMILTKDFL